MDPQNKLQIFREEMRNNILADLREGRLSYMGVATKNGTTVGTVFAIATKNGLRRKDQRTADTAVDGVKDVR